MGLASVDRDILISGRHKNANKTQRGAPQRVEIVRGAKEDGAVGLVLPAREWVIVPGIRGVRRVGEELHAHFRVSVHQTIVRNLIQQLKGVSVKAVGDDLC